MPDQKLNPDRQCILDHLRHITARWSELNAPCLLEIVHLTNDDRAAVKDVAHFRPDQIEEAADHIAAMNQHKLNSYATVNPVGADNRPAPGTRAKKENILASFFHWADADDKSAADNIQNFVGPKATFFVLTGTEPTMRPHVYWELEEPTLNLEAWSQTQRAIAATLKTDSAVVDPPRIMRVAGTINWPKPQKVAKGYKAQLTALRIYDKDERPRISSEQMARAFKGAPEAPETDWIDTGTQATPVADYEALLTRVRTDGEKHAAVRDMTARMAAAGVPRNMTEAMVKATCPVWDDNVESLIDTAYQKFYNAPLEPVTPESLKASEASADGLEWFEDIQPALTDSYLVKGMLSQGAMSVIYGPSNSGKTFWALDLSFAIAAGREWRGRRVNQAAVLYLAAEGGRGVANRMVALQRETGATNVPLALKRAGLDLLKSEADLNAIYALANQVKEKANGAPLLIVIDTLSRVMAGGDENSAADMTALIRNIDAIREATNAHIMLVHHTGKDTARGARGHSSLRAATDTEIEVQMTEDEEGQQHRAAAITKQRDYQGGEVFAFTLKSIPLGKDQDGDPVTSCVVVDASTEEFKAARRSKKGMGSAQKAICETFDAMLGDGLGRPNPGGVNMPEAGQFWTVEFETLREHARGKMAAADTRSSFNKAWKALVEERGTFCQAGKLVWRVDRRVSK